jgi:hypothetical protein
MASESKITDAVADTPAPKYEDEIYYLMDKVIATRLTLALRTQLYAFIDMIARDMKQDPIEMTRRVMVDQDTIPIYAKVICEKGKGDPAAKKERVKKDPPPADIRCNANSWGGGRRTQCVRKKKAECKYCQYHWLWSFHPDGLPYGEINEPFKLLPKEIKRIEKLNNIRTIKGVPYYIDELTHGIYSSRMDGSFVHCGMWHTDSEGAEIHVFF